jgi:hypothetical protein
VPLLESSFNRVQQLVQLVFLALPSLNVDGIWQFFSLHI